MDDSIRKLEVIVLELTGLLQTKGVTHDELIGRIHKRTGDLRIERSGAEAEQQGLYDRWIAAHEDAEELLSLYREMSMLRQKLPRLFAVKSSARATPGAQPPKPDEAK